MRKYLPFTIAKSFKKSFVRHCVADFETCYTSEERENVRVWAWGLLDYQTGEYLDGNNIDSFFEKIMNDKFVYDIGFHNLKFDGSFIVPKLFKMGFEYLPNNVFMDKWQNEEDLTNKFTHNITSMGQWFNIIIAKSTNANKSTPAFVNIWDTAKLFPNTKLKELGIQYNTNAQKIDENKEFYERIRPEGYKFNEEESAYLKADCAVLAEVLREQYSRYGTIYRTQASKAFHFFKEACTDEAGNNTYEKKYEGFQQWAVPDVAGLEDYKGAIVRYLPREVRKKLNESGAKVVDKKEYYIPDYYTWRDIKLAYNGGISYVNPRYQEQSLYERITTIDVNSMYPYVLKTFPIPYGRFTKKDGAPDLKNKNKAWIAGAVVSFRLKKETNLPCIQLKEKYGREWLRESTDFRKYGEMDEDNEDIIFFTSVDFETFKENYYFVVHKWLYHYEFAGISNKDGKAFVEPLYKAKQTADNVMNKLKKQFPDDYKSKDEFVKASMDRKETKVLMNSAYGKHGTKYFLYSKDSVYQGEGLPVKYESENTLGRNPDKEPSHYYCPYAAFVTAYARQMLVRAWNAFEGRAVYCDTDSIHFIGTKDDIPATLEASVDRKETGALGLWKVENEFVKGRYIRSKSYIEVKENGDEIITCAGATSDIKKLMNWETFRVGFNAWKLCDELNLDKKEHSKLTPKQYPDGVALEIVNFEIKSQKIC